MSTKDLRQEANEIFEHREDPDLAGEEVDLKPGGPLNMVIPVRFRDADAAAVSRAAEEARMPVSTFIRQAAVAAASETEVRLNKCTSWASKFPTTGRGAYG